MLGQVTIYLSCVIFATYDAGDITLCGTMIFNIDYFIIGKKILSIGCKNKKYIR